ncbi:MAG: hypothetical protein WBF90_35955 [Rivularia sp. (in: cyanobacteria)]
MKKLEIRITGTPDDIGEFTDFLDSLGVELEDLNVMTAGKFYPRRGELLKSSKYVHIEFKENAFKQFTDA